jgi:hypothetical protein
LDEWDRPYFAVAILLLAVALERCTPELTKFLIAAADSSELPLSELFDQCLRAERWREVTRSVLTEPGATDENLAALATALVGDDNEG